MKTIPFAALMTIRVAVGTAEARHYGSAGCGLGSLVFSPTGGQIFAATTNGSSYSQLFGITSGTSNCTDAGHTASIRVPAFIAANRPSLEKDIARGNGETLATLAGMMGCQDNARFGSVLQQNYSNLFPQPLIVPENVRDTLYDAVKADETLARDCKNVI